MTMTMKTEAIGDCIRSQGSSLKRIDIAREAYNELAVIEADNLQLQRNWEAQSALIQTVAMDVLGQDQKIAKLRTLCKQAAEYVDNHIQAISIYRRTGDILVAPPFLAELREAGDCPPQQPPR